MRTAILTTAFLAAVCPVAAQQPTAQDSAERRAQQATTMMMDRMMRQMAPMMGQMTSLALEGTLQTLAKPENAERLADFTKNYYEALIKRGFTKEQALAIVTVVGIPRATAAGR